MATVADLQTKIAAVPWENTNQGISGDAIRDLFVTVAALAASSAADAAVITNSFGRPIGSAAVILTSGGGSGIVSPFTLDANS